MVKVKGQGHQGQKNEKLLTSPLTMRSMACALGRTQEAATDDTIVWPRGWRAMLVGKSAHAV